MHQSFSKKQSVQESEYSIPYHYIPTVDESGFSQTLFWSWGMRYLGGIELVLSRLNSVNFESLLDIGCGDGRFLREVSRRYSNIDLKGVDYSRTAVQLAKAMNPAIEYLCADITAESLPKKYDVVTMIEVLEHIPPEIIPDFLLAVADCLVLPGKLILTVPHTNKRVQEKHYQHFTSASLQKTLEPFFTVDRIIPFDRISRITGWMLRLLGYTSNNYLITNKRLNSFVYKRVLQGCLQEQKEEDCGRLMAVVKKNVNRR